VGLLGSLYDKPLMYIKIIHDVPESKSR